MITFTILIALDLLPEAEAAEAAGPLASGISKTVGRSLSYYDNIILKKTIFLVKYFKMTSHCGFREIYKLPLYAILQL